MAVFFIVYFFGALMQTLPTSWLFLKTFGEEQFRWGRKHSFLGCAVISLLGSFLFALVSALLLGHVGPLQILEGSLLLNIVVCVLVIYLWRCLTADRSERFLALLLVVHYEAVVVTVNSFLMGAEGIPGWTELRGACYAPLAPVGLFLITALTWPAASWFFGRLLRDFLATMAGINVKSACIYVAVIMGITFLGDWYFLSVDNGQAMAYMLLSLFVNLAAYCMFFRGTKKVRENEALRRQIEMMEQQYHQTSRHIQDMSRLRHDIRHHLRTISVLNTEGKREEIARYLEEYEVNYQKLERVSLCGYIPVDTILNYYMAQAAECGVSMEIINKLKGSYPFSSVDMTVLLGNCLENALEACTSAEAGKAFVQVKLQAVNSSLLIRIVNSTEKNENPDEGFHEYAFVPSGTESGHGYGLNSVAQIAEKYRGIVEVCRGRDTFSIQIALSIPQERRS